MDIATGSGSDMPCSAGLLEVGFLGSAVAFDSEGAPAACQDPARARWPSGLNTAISAAEVPAYQLNGKSATQHDSRGLGIAPNVVLGSGELRSLRNTARRP